MKDITLMPTYARYYLFHIGRIFAVTIRTCVSVLHERTLLTTY